VFQPLSTSIWLKDTPKRSAFRISNLLFYQTSVIDKMDKKTTICKLLNLFFISLSLKNKGPEVIINCNKFKKFFTFAA